jgi:hypothetical protein
MISSGRRSVSLYVCGILTTKGFVSALLAEEYGSGAILIADTESLDNTELLSSMSKITMLNANDVTGSKEESERYTNRRSIRDMALAHGIACSLCLALHASVASSRSTLLRSITRRRPKG